MIDKLVTYPWGERYVSYDDFIFKIVRTVPGQEAGEVIEEHRITDVAHYKDYYYLISVLRKSADIVKEYNKTCFSYRENGEIYTIYLFGNVSLKQNSKVW